MQKKKIQFAVKPTHKYRLSIISLLIISVLLIISIWYWFDMKTRELDQQTGHKDRARYVQADQ